MTPGPAGYEDDFFAWTQEQARLLRARAFDRLDIENVAEEIESLGRADRRELGGLLRSLLTHLLKWRDEPGARSGSLKRTVRQARRKMNDLLGESPSLVPHFQGRLGEYYAEAREHAAAETGLPADRFPAACPWTLEQILDRAFLPPES